MKVKPLGNRSTISIERCGLEDSGEYMCKAGYTIANKTFWANVTTNFKFQAKLDFSLQTFIWILICVTVFLVNSTIATLTCRRRSTEIFYLFTLIGRRFLKGSGSTGTAGIYYAAPSTTKSSSQYNSTRPQNDTDATNNAASSLYAEILDEQVHQEESDEIIHHYIEQFSAKFYSFLLYYDLNFFNVITIFVITPKE
ncbi:unnamed protein product [Mytilus coruscus]|uniref:Uncharacterized protein n=1 Tax=Mytilus coruscus TaxID=42192 RepID=A0A6J8F5E9_MYTCO|nr:unnamed protein product [Mytilus coruscus]